MKTAAVSLALLTSVVQPGTVKNRSEKTMPVAISTAALSDQLGATQVIDVRRSPAFDGSATMISMAIWRDPAEVTVWLQELDRSRPVVVYCVHGHEVSQGCAAFLENSKFRVAYLEGGFAAWSEEGRPAQAKPAQEERHEVGYP